MTAARQTGSPAPLLFAPAESATLAAEIARCADVELGPLEERSFEGGEFKLRPLVSVRDRTVVVAQSLASSQDCDAAQRLLRLLFLLFGLRDAGAAQLIAFVPYLAFARKDRRTQPRDPVSARYVAQLIESTRLDSLCALDVHNPAAFDNAFRIPVNHLTALPMFARNFAERNFRGGISVASPDVGGVKRVQIFRDLLQNALERNIDLAFVEKRRSAGNISGGAVVGDVRDKTVIVLDDLCASGQTLIHAASALRAAGAATIHVACTHAPMPQGIDALRATDCISSIVCTDSVASALELAPHAEGSPLTVLPVAPLLGDALGRMLAGRPLAPLFESWPPQD